MVEKKTKPVKEFTGRHMFILLALFFGVIITVNLIMATIASSTWTGLIVKNGYVASQDFNKELENAKRQDENGWVGRFKYDGVRVVFGLNDASGQPIDKAVLQIELGRPAFEAEDRTLTLLPLGNGLYEVKALLGSGIWQYRITGEISEKNYRLEDRFMVKAAKTDLVKKNDAEQGVAQ